MAQQGGNAKLKLVLSHDSTSAELCVPAGADPEGVTAEAGVGLLFEAGITVDDESRAIIDQLIESWKPGSEVRAVVVRGRAAKHGANGRVEWKPEVLSEQEREELGIDDPASHHADGEHADDDADEFEPASPVSFYDRCAFVMVQKDQKLGRIVPPEDGEDGEDVMGRVLSAKAGRAAKLRVDDSIMIDAEGWIISQQDGVLSRTLDKAAVRNYLEIPGAVDFSTGNIDFDGDVKINNGVRDLFEVVATGNIDVRGLIESAVIETDGDVVSAGGMAGRERGKLRAGGDLTIRYVDSAEVHVGGNLHIEREVINCVMLVHGRVESPRASIIGGRLVAIGSIEVSALGSDGGTPTEVVVGSVPPLEERLVKLDGLITKLERQREVAQREMEQFKLPGRVRTPEDAERETEVSFALMSVDGQLGKCNAKRRELIDKINGLRVVDLRVQRMLHQGVTVVCGVQRITLREDVKGPVRVLRDRRGELCYRVGDGGSNVPLRQIGDIHATAA